MAFELPSVSGDCKNMNECVRGEGRTERNGRGEPLCAVEVMVGSKPPLNFADAFDVRLASSTRSQKV